MNINLNFDMNDQIYDLLDGFFLAMLKDELKTELTSYGEDKIFNGDDDIEHSKDRVKALKVLIEHHTTRAEYDLIMQQMEDLYEDGSV